MLSFLSAHSKLEDFPDKFSDQVYYSNGCQFDHFSYKSVYSLKYVFEGFECYDVGGRNLNIKSGEFGIVNNNSPVTFLPPAAGKAISVFIDPATLTEACFNVFGSESDLLEDPFLENYNNSPLFYESTFNANSGALGKSLQLTFQKVVFMLSSDMGKVSKSLFYRLAAELVKSQSENATKLKQLDFVKNSTRQELLARLKMAESFLKDHPYENFYLEDLAQTAALSPYHFHRSFVKVFGMSPMKYHQALKIEKAKILLLTKDQSINELATFLGFADSSSFGKIFKRLTGFTPVQWKKSNLRPLHPISPT